MFWSTVANNLATNMYRSTVVNRLATNTFRSTVAKRLATTMLRSTVVNKLATNMFRSTVDNRLATNMFRSTVANRLATDGKSWTNIFSIHNSGTYNNQWMVVDYNKFTPGDKELKPNLLWVLEQIPGYIQTKDLTQVKEFKVFCQKALFFYLFFCNLMVQTSNLDSFI